MDDGAPLKAGTWWTTHGDMSDEEWALVADLVEPYSSRGPMGRPVKNDRRDVVNAIFYVAATGCQWRALPASYPHWNTVHRHHLRWSHDGTWERVCDRLRSLVREKEGRDADPSGSVIDARSVRGASTVTSATRGYDAGKKVSGPRPSASSTPWGSLSRPGRRCLDERQLRWHRRDRPGAQEVEPLRQGVLRRWVQANLRRALRWSSSLSRGREAHPRRRLRSPSSSLRRRANVVGAD